MENNALKDKIIAISEFRKKLKEESLKVGDELENMQYYYDLLTLTPKPEDSAQKKEREDYLKQLKEKAISIDTARECLKWQIVSQKVIIPFANCFLLALKNIRRVREYQVELDAVADASSQVIGLVAEDVDVELIKEALKDIIWEEIGCPDYALESIDNELEQALSYTQSITHENDPVAISILSSRIQLSQMLSTYYERYYNQFDSYVNNILEGLLDNENIHDLVKKIKDKKLVDFLLPEDYFDLPSGEDSEFIGSIDSEYCNTDAIMNMINFFASEGHIENTSLVKQNFAYRLTGKMKPACIIEKITWSKTTYRLFIMCRHLYGGKYEKMKKFFDAKDDHNFSSKPGGSYGEDRRDKRFDNLMKDWFGVK